VKVLKAMLSVLFLAMWLPAMNCCMLQNLGMFAQDDCCAATEESHKTTCDESCSRSVSLAQGKNQSFTFVPVLILASVTVETEMTTLEKPSAPFLHSEQKEFFKQWHFKERAALPVRAPSLAS